MIKPWAITSSSPSEMSFPDIPFTCVFLHDSLFEVSFFDVCRDRTEAMITQIKDTFD